MITAFCRRSHSATPGADISCGAPSGAFDPHAAASLIVFQLRDADEPLCTNSLRADLLSDASYADEDTRLDALRETLQLLPAANRALLSALAELGVAVSKEHAACYQDGLDTRKEGLAQLLGPLITRPQPATFETDMAAAVSFATDLLKHPWLLATPVQRKQSTDSEATLPISEAPPPSHAAPPPLIPSLSLPVSRAAPTPRAVTFREGGGGGGLGGPEDDGEDSDETNYNAVKTKADEHALFAQQVAFPPAPRWCNGAMVRWCNVAMEDYWMAGAPIILDANHPPPSTR